MGGAGHILSHSGFYTISGSLSLPKTWYSLIFLTFAPGTPVALPVGKRYLFLCSPPWATCPWRIRNFKPPLVAETDRDNAFPSVVADVDDLFVVISMGVDPSRPE